MEENIKKPTVNKTKELEKELMDTKIAYAKLQEAATKKLNEMNYANMFQQQQFMLEIVKLHEVFGEEITTKAINAIDKCWFSTEENSNEE